MKNVLLLFLRPYGLFNSHSYVVAEFYTFGTYCTSILQGRKADFTDTSF